MTTKQGKLKIGGLIQVWYYSIANDTKGRGYNTNDGDPQDVADRDSGEGVDNDSFRIRRAELKFSMDIHENVSGVVMIDPARMANSFPGLPDNTSNLHAALGNATFKQHNEEDFEWNGDPSIRTPFRSLRRGSADANMMPSLIEAAKANATVGEMMVTMKSVFGAYDGGPEW